MQEGKQKEDSPTENSWQYRPEDTDSLQPNHHTHSPSQESLSWTASEFIAQEKNIGWYVLLGVAASVGSILVFLLTKDKISSIMIVLVALAFGIFAARQPRVLQYKIDTSGLTIGQKFYPYSLFKSFSVLQEGAIRSISLMPLKRFMSVISLYYPPENEEKILDFLSIELPYEERDHDVVDRFMRKIRF